jgi:hypothetical protein
MDDAVFMDVLNPSQDLLHEADWFFLIESLSFDDVVEKFTSFCVLHYEMNIGLGFDDLARERSTS